MPTNDVTPMSPAEVASLGWYPNWVCDMGQEELRNLVRRLRVTLGAAHERIVELTCERDSLLTIVGQRGIELAALKRERVEFGALAIARGIELDTLEQANQVLRDTITALGETAKNTLGLYDIYTGMARTELQTQQVFGAIITTLQAVIAAAEALPKAAEKG